LPEGLTLVDAQFMDISEPIIELHGYDFEQIGDQIVLTLYWGALEPGRFDYTRFVHLIDPLVDQPPVVQSDGMPRNGFYPTGQWVAGEVVSDQVKLDLGNVTAGEYQIMVGLYRNLGNSFPRLTAVDSQNNRLPNDRFSLPNIIRVKKD